MIGYKFKYTGNIGTEVVTANCGSELYFAISNDGDSEATVKLFNGETELSADTTNLKFVLPDGEYSQFYIITPETPETKEYTAVITGADDSYVHKIQIRLIAEQSTRCLEDVLYYKIDDLTSIGNRVIKVPLNSNILVGIPFSSDNHFCQYMTIDDSSWDSSLKQGATRVIPDWENPTPKQYGNSLRFGTLPLKIKTGTQPCQKHIKAQVHSKSRTIEYRDITAFKAEIQLKDGTTEYYAVEQIETSGSASVGHTIYHLDSENNVLGYVDCWNFHGLTISVKIGGRIRQVWHEMYSADITTVVGDFPLEIMPWVYTYSSSGLYIYTLPLTAESTTLPVTTETITLNNVPCTVYTDNETKEIDVLFDIIDQKTMINCIYSDRQYDYFAYKFNFDDSIGENVVSVPEGIMPQFAIPKLNQNVLLSDIDTGAYFGRSTYPSLPNYFVCDGNLGDITYFNVGTHHLKASTTITNPDETTTTKTLYIRLEHNNDTKFE